MVTWRHVEYGKINKMVIYDALTHEKLKPYARYYDNVLLCNVNLYSLNVGSQYIVNHQLVTNTGHRCLFYKVNIMPYDIVTRNIDPKRYSWVKPLCMCQKGHDRIQ